MGFHEKWVNTQKITKVWYSRGGAPWLRAYRGRATQQDYVFHCFSIFEVFLGVSFSWFGIFRVLFSRFWYFLVFLGRKYSRFGIFGTDGVGEFLFFVILLLIGLKHLHLIIKCFMCKSKMILFVWHNLCKFSFLSVTVVNNIKFKEVELYIYYFPIFQQYVQSEWR